MWAPVWDPSRFVHGCQVGPTWASPCPGGAHLDPTWAPCGQPMWVLNGSLGGPTWVAQVGSRWVPLGLGQPTWGPLGARGQNVVGPNRARPRGPNLGMLAGKMHVHQLHG